MDPHRQRHGQPEMAQQTMSVSVWQFLIGWTRYVFLVKLGFLKVIVDSPLPEHFIPTSLRQISIAVLSEQCLWVICHHCNQATILKSGQWEQIQYFLQKYQQTKINNDADWWCSYAATPLTHGNAPRQATAFDSWRCKHYFEFISTFLGILWFVVQHVHMMWHKTISKSLHQTS